MHRRFHLLQTTVTSNLHLMTAVIQHHEDFIAEGAAMYWRPAMMVKSFSSFRTVCFHFWPNSVGDAPSITIDDTVS